MIFEKPKQKEDHHLRIEAEIKKELAMVDSRPRKGHTMFEYNVQTGELKKAVIEKSSYHFGGTYRHTVKVNEFCQYLSCLNRKNAIKKLESLKLIITNK